MKTKNLLSSIEFVLILGFIVSLPFYINLNSFIIILLAINFIARLVMEPHFFFGEKSKYVFIFVLLFLLYLVVFLLAARHGTWFVIEKKISLLIFPIIFGFTNRESFDDGKVRIILLSFVMAVIVAIIVSFKSNFHVLLADHQDNIDSFLIMHRPYFGMYVLFSVFILIYLASSLNKLYFTIILFFLACILAYFAYIIYAKMAIGSFIIALFITIAVFLFKRAKRSFAFLFLIFFTLPLFFLVLSNEYVNEILRKVASGQSFDLAQYRWIYFLSLNIRYVIWECVWKLLSTDYNWIFGCGLENQRLLNACYYSDGSIWFKYNLDPSMPMISEHFSFNAHNEYLQCWLDTGIIGFLALLASFVASIQIALRKENFLYLAFSIFFIFCCLTESMLSSQKGIVFYSFFNSFFAFEFFKPMQKKDSI